MIFDRQQEVTSLPIKLDSMYGDVFPRNGSQVRSDTHTRASLIDSSIPGWSRVVRGPHHPWQETGDKLLHFVHHQSLKLNGGWRAAWFGGAFFRVCVCSSSRFAWLVVHGSELFQWDDIDFQLEGGKEAMETGRVSTRIKIVYVFVGVTARQSLIQSVVCEKTQ